MMMMMTPLVFMVLLAAVLVMRPSCGRHAAEAFESLPGSGGLVGDPEFIVDAVARHPPSMPGDLLQVALFGGPSGGVAFLHFGRDPARRWIGMHSNIMYFLSSAWWTAQLAPGASADAARTYAVTVARPAAFETDEAMMAAMQRYVGQFA